jgi:hypothetical protein
MVLESEGIDFILGIDRLRKDKGLTNCATKAIKPTTKDRKRLEYVVETITIYWQRSNQPH